MRTKITVDKPASGILYILFIKLEGKELTKAGVTCRTKVEDRVLEIILAIWKKYRIFPETYVKRFRKVDEVYKREKELHKQLAGFSYTTEHSFSGSTEFFEVDQELVVEMYERLLDENKD